MDGSLRTLLLTLAAELALRRVDVGQIVCQRNGLEGAHLYAFATTDTAHLARLAGDGAFVLVDARISMMRRGQAFTQAPQAVQAASSTSGRPVSGFMRMAPN